MEISMRIDHGPVQTNTMSYPQRQPQTHRPTHNQASHAASAADIYKRSRSPLPATGRYPYPASPQLQPQPPPVSALNQVQVSQRYQAAPPAPTAVSAAAAPPLLSAGVYRDFRPNRISLLHPEYGPGRPRESAIQASVVCVDGLQGGGQQPLKKIRLQDKEGIQPLRIDTREQPGTYNPQVEAISPTLDQLTQDDQAFRTTKDELIQQIGKVDREIAKAESQIAILKKKQAELEEIANKPSVKPEVEEDAPKHQSLPQKIYAENRKKAQNAHAQLDPLGPKVEWPLYNQPSDAPAYHENKRKNVAFKRRLLEYFKKRHTEKESRNSYLTETYSKMMQEWLRKVDKIESSTKRKAKEAKNREFFEKVFPELRKQREDKERFNRVGARVKSEADMEEIMDNLQEQALEDKKMRSYAVIPPILLDQRERKIEYKNNNGFIADMEAEYKSRHFLNVWTPSEMEVFKEKYLQHPKNFGVIASYLDRKSVSDCVQYYYLSKKTENYKQLIRKARQQRTRSARNNTAKVSNSANTSVVDIMTSGVTTRLQREQQAKTVNQHPRSDSQQPEPTTSSSPPASTATTAGSPPSSAVTTTTTAATPSTAASPSASSAAATGTTSSLPSTATTSNCVSTNTSVISTSSSATVATAASSTAAASPTGTATNDMPMDTDEGKGQGFAGCFGAPTEELFGKEGAKEGTAGVILEGQKQAEGPTVKKESESPQETVSDQNTMNNSLVMENKKKKERRKDKDAAIETSDEEANTGQDNACHGNCVVCQAQLGPQLQSRPLVLSQASQYGLREDQMPPNARVCNLCRCKCVRSRYTHCPLPNCPNSRGRIKRLRSFPYRYQDLPTDVREAVAAEFHIPSVLEHPSDTCLELAERRLLKLSACDVLIKKKDWIRKLSVSYRPDTQKVRHIVTCNAKTAPRVPKIRSSSLLYPCIESEEDEWWTEEGEESDDNGSSSSQNTSISKSSKKRHYPPKPRELVPGHTLPIEVICVESKITVVWQDGSEEKEIPSTQLYYSISLDDHEFFPGEWVTSDTTKGECTEKYGVVQNVNYLERTACVKWFTYSENEKTPAELMKNEMSVYDLKKHSKFVFRPGSIVKSKPAQDDKMGKVIDSCVEGYVKVQWLDGTEENCWPHNIELIPETAEYDFSDEESSDEDAACVSWETESIESYAGDLSDETVLQNMAARLDFVRNRIIYLKEAFKQHTITENFSFLKDLLLVYENSSYLDKLLGTSFFSLKSKHFQTLLMNAKEKAKTLGVELRGRLFSGDNLCPSISKIKLAEKENINKMIKLENRINAQIEKKEGSKEATVPTSPLTPDSTEVTYMSQENLCVELLSMLKMRMDLAYAEIISRIGGTQALSVLTKASENVATPASSTPLPSCPTTPDESFSAMSPLRPKFSDKASEIENEPYAIVEDAPVMHHFYSGKFEPTDLQRFLKAVQKEYKLLKESLPPGVWVRSYGNRIDLLSVMIQGPSKTPYEDGLFLFDIQLSPDYPRSPPLVHYISYSSERLNPNLYVEGKVCVSLLGTWMGRGTEVWGPKSTLLQLIVSIQGLILVSEPYYNEAGYEKQTDTQQGYENSRTYNELVILKLVQSMTELLLSPPEVFKREIFSHFAQNGQHLCDRLNKFCSETDPLVPDFPLLPVSKGLKLSLSNALISFHNVLKKEVIEGNSAKPLPSV